MTLPEVNIGLVGHVDHGKTTLVERLSGVWTDRHSEELKKGITIKLGYADCSFYKCKKCKGAEAYSIQKKCPACGSETEFLRTVSFVDAPGHETLMATMLSGAALMDGAVLLVAANEPCPQPQTKEHLMAIDIVGVKNLVIVQNKVDLVSEKEALEHYKKIKAFVKGTVAENAPIIPMSAQHGTNLDVLINAIQDTIPSPKLKEGVEPIMLIARSFDVNKPGTPIKNLKGGVLGGALVQGELNVGDEIEISPSEEVKSTIKNLFTGGKPVKKVTRGGTFGVETGLDPSITKSDKLSGKVLSHPGKLPPVRDSLDLEVHLLDRVVGSAQDVEVKGLNLNEDLMLNVGTSTTLGTVISGSKDNFTLKLKLPVCMREGKRATIARRYGTRWRLIGYGIVK